MAKCNHPDCRKEVPETIYACAPHWKSLPGDIRGAIWRGWKTSTTAGRAAHERAQNFWKGNPGGSPPEPAKEWVTDEGGQISEALEYLLETDRGNSFFDSLRECFERTGRLSEAQFSHLRRAYERKAFR